MRLPALVLVGLVGLLAEPTALKAQDENCREVTATARMARAPSRTALETARTSAGKSYRARLVFAFRSFQLHRTRQNAESLLSLIPADENQRLVVLTLGDNLCGEDMKAMSALDNVGEHLPREFSEAVILAPNYMRQYVAYALEAVLDPHNDFAVRMVKVCRNAHSELDSAVKQLPMESQIAFSKHILDIEHCKALAIPEAEQ